MYSNTKAKEVVEEEQSLLAGDNEVATLERSRRAKSRVSTKETAKPPKAFLDAQKTHSRQLVA